MMKKPNLIYVLADDMGYGDVSYLNERCAFKTFAFDDICANGLAFTDAHASSAVCTPSRYSILTGRYNWRSCLKKDVLGGYSKPLIESGRMTVAGMLREQGYRTAVVGKWHLGMDIAGVEENSSGFDPPPGIDYHERINNSPLGYGFDYFYGISASLDMPPYIYIENEHFTALPVQNTEGTGKGYWRRGPTAENFVHEQVLQKLTEKALALIEQWAASPFFLYFPLTAPHPPILPAAKFRGKSGTNEYGDFVLMCDDVVSQIIQKLKEVGIYENTILIFTSDNGCTPKADFEELAGKGHNPSYHFRGHKADIYEGGHRIPYLIQWPEFIAPGGLCSRIVCLSDLLSTIADCLDVPLSDNAAEDSFSNMPLWKNPNDAPVRTELVHQSVDGSLSIRRGDWKLEMCPGSGGWSAPRPGEESKDAPRCQLYNMASDIGERRNLINEQANIAADLRKDLKEIVMRGRSTPGSPQQNDGAPVWDTVRWLNEP
jgi:arylsulfatase A-like enzyme